MPLTLRITIGLVACLSFGCAEKPVLEVTSAREALAAARDLEADIYAPEAYELAVFNLQGAEAAIAEQDQRIFWSRNYTMAIELLALSRAQAREAEIMAESVKRQSLEEVERLLPEAQRAFDAAFQAVERARPRVATRQELMALDEELNSIYALLTEGRDLFEAAAYPGSAERLRETAERARLLERTALEIAARIVEEPFRGSETLDRF